MCEERFLPKKAGKSVYIYGSENKTMKEISVVLVGVGGYGAVIAEQMFRGAREWGAHIVGVVDPAYETTPTRVLAQREGVPHYATLEEFYAVSGAELAVICSPIQFHEEQVIYAMEHGSDCLCEKPTAATVEQSDRMAAAAARTGRTLHIGFQLCYVPAVLALKKDILSGALGKPRVLSAVVLWPRGRAYYARPWCGKLTQNGHPVLDSIAMNACAHYLNVMLFLLGDAPDRAATPSRMEGFTARINDIETFDTACLRLAVGDAKVDFLATHACEKNIGPLMRFTFDEGIVELRETDDEDAVRLIRRDGTVKSYGPVSRDFYRKLPYCVAATRDGLSPLCTPATARAHLNVVETLTRRVSVKTDLPWSERGDVRVIDGLDELLLACYESNEMPWERAGAYAPTVIEWEENA